MFMATDLTVRRVKGTSANIGTTFAADLATAGCNKANLATATAATISSDCIIITYTFG